MGEHCSFFLPIPQEGEDKRKDKKTERGKTYTPRYELLAAVILVNRALNQGGASLVLIRLGNRVLQLARRVGDEADTLAVGRVERLHQQGVVPVLDLVVRAIVDLDLDRVAAVVDQENRNGQVEAHHLRHFLGGDLEGAVAAHADRPAVGVPDGVAEGCRDGPANVAPLHLNLVARALGQRQLRAVEPRVARLDEECRVGRHQSLQLALDLLAGELVLVVGLVHDVRVGAEPVVLDHGGVVELHLGGQVVEELGQTHAREVRAGEGDVVHVALHQRDVGHSGPAHGGVVVEDAAGADDGVGPVEDGIRGHRRHLTPEDAHKLRVVLGEHALGGGLHGNGTAHGLGQLDEGLVSAGARQFGADQDHGLELALQVLSGTVGGGSQSGLVRVYGLGDSGDGTGAHTAGAGQVGGDLDVAGFPGQEGSTDGSVDQPGRLLSAVDGDGATCDLLGHLELVGVVQLAQGVVQQVELAGIVGVGRAGNQNQGQVLGVSGAGAVEGGDGADTVGDDAGGDAIGTGVALGGHAAVELIGAADFLEVGVRLELVEEDEVVVAGHHEVVTDADLGQPLGEVVTDGVLSRCARHWEFICVGKV